MIDQLIINSRIKEEPISADKDTSEKTMRSVAKTISWRVIGTIDTVLISWLITGTLRLAFSIGLVELVTKMVLYFFHERFWNTVKWGK
jgi:uncharacterized membrane protein